MIKGEEKNRGMWKIGVVESLITGRDGVTRACKASSWKVLFGKSHPASVSFRITVSRKTKKESRAECTGKRI